MHFQLRASDRSDGVLGSREGSRALARLEWALSEFETPQPVAIDVSELASISPSFIEAFFVPLSLDPPSGPYGPHAVIVVGASAGVAQMIRDCLATHGCSVLIQRGR
jgi:hypothetical protein